MIRVMSLWRNSLRVFLGLNLSKIQWWSYCISILKIKVLKRSIVSFSISNGKYSKIVFQKIVLYYWSLFYSVCLCLFNSLSVRPILASHFVKLLRSVILTVETAEKKIYCLNYFLVTWDPKRDPNDINEWVWMLLW